MRVGISLWRQNDLYHSVRVQDLVSRAALLKKPHDEYFKAIIAPIAVPLPWRGVRVFAVLHKCANPDCSQPFKYFRHGKLFSFEMESRSGIPEKSKKSRKVLWLCGIPLRFAYS